MGKGREYLSNDLQGFDAYLRKQVSSPMNWLLHRQDLSTARTVLKKRVENEYESARAWQFQYRSYIDYLLKVLQVNVF